MAGSYSKLADKGFRNWIKSYFAGNIAKEGVEEFIYNEIEMFHKEVLSKTLSPEQLLAGKICCECTTENIIPCPTKTLCTVRFGKCTTFHTTEQKGYPTCPNNICDRLREEIKRSHKYNNPSWKNTHANAWCHTPWEIAKCYLPPDGYLDKTTVKETDLNGILSIMLNHKLVTQVIDENTCLKIRDQSRKLRHSPDLCVDDNDLNDYLANLETLLTCSERLKSDAAAKQAVYTIQKLKADTISISTNDVTDIIDKAIEEKTYSALQEIDKNVEEKLAKIRASLNEPTSCTTVPITEERYQELKHKLKEDLVCFNNIQHGNIPLSPLFEDNDGTLLDFHIVPNMCSVEADISIPYRTERRLPVESLKTLFYNQDKTCREIYLTANAGFGKTVFSKRLAVTWCHANEPSVDRQSFSEEDICIMEKFEFLFLISLRDVGSDCDVDDMILHQIISCLSHSFYYTIEFLQEILHREKCMIILDGLDEWSHPANDCRRVPNNIPHRKARVLSTVVTTSRPWKLSSLRINKSQVDRRLEILELGETSRRKLIRQVIAKLSHHENDQIEDHIERFENELMRAEVKFFETTPLMMMHLICLWCDGTPFGSSKCELLSNIVELMMMRAAQKPAEFQIQMKGLADDSFDIPECFQNHEYCKEHYQCLIALGKLAFITLFGKKREFRLSFDRTLAENTLTSNVLNFSFVAGILTQTKITGKLTSQPLKVSFVHRTFQDFFAALYIQTNPPDAAVTITDVCDSVDMILELTDFLTFISGFAPKILNVVSQAMVKTVSNDEIVGKYRSTLSGWLFYRIERSLKAIQNLNVACMNENMQHNKDNLQLRLEDFILDKECQEDRYLHTVKEMIKMNKGKMKSFVIREENISLIHEIIESCDLENINSLVKIYIRGDCRQYDMDCLLKGSKDTLKYVTFVSCVWQDNYFKPKHIPWPETTSNILKSIQHLEGIGLDSFDMTHEEFQKVLAFLTGNISMKEISLYNIKCSDHLDKCEGLCLNLSKHTNLKVLELKHVPLSEIKADVSSLEECLVGQCCTAAASTECLGKLPYAKQLQNFTATGLNSTDEVEEMLQVLPRLTKLQTIALWDIEMLNRDLNLSPDMLCIEYIILMKAKFSCAALKSLVETVEEYRQSVKVEIVDCEILPKEEFESVKTYIINSSRFVNIYHGLGRFKRMTFSFQTHRMDGALAET